MYAIAHPLGPTLWGMAAKRQPAAEPVDPSTYMREKRGPMSYRDLAKRTGIAHSYLAELEKGLRPWGGVGLDTLESIAAGLGVDSEEFIRVVRGKQMANDLSPALTGYSPEDTEEVDFWGTVSAGNGHSAAQPLGKVRWEKDVVRKYRRYGLYVLDVNGTSMFAEDIPYSIPPGARVLVARELAPQASDVVVVWLPDRGKNGEGVLKGWKSTREHLVLKSWNRNVPPIVISPDEPHILQGVVIDVRFSPRNIPSDILKQSR